LDEQVKADAREFGLHVKQGGWRLGLLVARNVERGNGGRGRTGVSRSRNPDKVTAAAFARMAGTSADRVLRYLDAWDKAAEHGTLYTTPKGVRVRVLHSDEMVPGQEVRGLDAEYLPPWEEFYDASGSGGRPRDSKPEDAVKILSNPEKRAAAVAQMPAEEKAALADELFNQGPDANLETASQMSDDALGAIDTAASTSSYLRKEARRQPPPENAASRKLGGVGPQAMADKLFNESMEPRLNRIHSAFKSAEIQWLKFGFRLALTPVEEFEELDAQMREIGTLYAQMMDLYDAAKEAKVANEAEGAKA
jgi:hypothetical protein